MSNPRKIPLTKRLSWVLEAVGALAAYGILRILPIDAASALGAAILSRIGPMLRLHKVARTNLERAFPEKSAEEIARILHGMWRNLGRTAGEFAHIRTLQREMDRRVEIVGAEHALAAMRAGGPAIYVSGHIANWELMLLAAAHVGLVMDGVYRAPDNPLIASLYDKRKSHPDAALFPKGSAGARGVMDALKRGRPLGLLIDQKMNDGIEARFFGRRAMTTPAFAQLARRFDCPIVAVRVERLEGARFRVTAFEGVKVPRDGKPSDDVAATVQRFNDLLESWIRERPEQWLWVHRRWPKGE
ncbi:lauroyl acyltransferase [Thalassobaculum sp. OXR-137]|uniref:LpxL/LpxP family acyltransferase n=1 Tax=Thalassobaculum sp. OXR-137 TaxID=3100173 RepID=UPI002AC8F80C|nr:lauroyl acyltransferase [Thalassobaculum sp. OXR-137]WPZ32511.1 lauroyl acyltransferase [Thalassobaculum sp. OXR-137]